MTSLKPTEIKALKKVLDSKGYKVFDEPYKLNIVGIRSNITKPNSFDDSINAFYKNKDNQWEGYTFPATTDAGTFWLTNPMQSKGTALLKEGQYKDSHKLGLHRGKYKALVQQNNVVVYRDYDRNAVLDFNNGKEETGNFGINIHRANSTGTTKTIDKYSAGCQVFANADDFQKFLQLAEASKDKHGNNFTYTLIDERAYNRKTKKYWVYTLISTVAVIGGFIAYKKLKNKL
jgi:hypothetical protein